MKRFFARRTDRARRRDARERDDDSALRVQLPHLRRDVEIRASAYETVRSHGDRFALLEGHDDPSVERVVERGLGYVVVEKLGEGAEIARGLDPRA